jgi:hypothetical protein
MMAACRNIQTAPARQYVKEQCATSQPATPALRCSQRTRHDRLPVWRHCQVQHPHGVPRQHGHLLHGWVPPHDDLVLAVAVRADQLVHVLGPGQVADLWEEEGEQERSSVG